MCVSLLWYIHPPLRVVPVQLNPFSLSALFVFPIVSVCSCVNHRLSETEGEDGTGESARPEGEAAGKGEIRAGFPLDAAATAAPMVEESFYRNNGGNFPEANDKYVYTRRENACYHILHISFKKEKKEEQVTFNILSLFSTIFMPVIVVIVLSCMIKRTSG